MTSMEELGATVALTAEIIARQPDTFDFQAAELTLRNIAVLSDRLTPKEFNALTKESQDKLSIVANIAHQLAPISEADTLQLTEETNEEHQYRVAIWLPLHSLQSFVSSRKYNEDNANEMSKIRFGVDAAGKAFAGVLLETKEQPVIAETERYFWGNAIAAAKRAKRLQKADKQ